MHTGVFGPTLYSLENQEETASGLVADILAIPELRKTWVPDVGPNLFHTQNPVGCYDKHMRKILIEESRAWTRSLKEFPTLPRPLQAPPRSGMIPRGRIHLRSMEGVFDVPDTPFWHAAAEQTYGYIRCMEDENLLCRDCVHGTASVGVLATFPDYYHFCQELYPVLEISARRTAEFIDHVHRCHPHGGEDQKVMDAWLATLQAIFLDVLHPKADSLKLPDNELQSIRYRLVNSGVRALVLQARLEKGPLIGDDITIDAVSFAMITMHDACDYRHDNRANEYYNVMTIVSAHREVQGVGLIRRFCLDVWAWAIDNEADWAILVAGRLLAWQLYMARYRTPILFDNLIPGNSTDRPRENPYSDAVLNSMNPLPPSTHPDDFNLRNRCGNKNRYDELLQECLAHFRTCSGCHRYDKASWQDRVPLIGNAYMKKYSDCGCLNTIGTYMILADMKPVWWAMDYTAEYTGPLEEWSPMLC